MLSLKQKDQKKVENLLKKVLEKKRGKLEKLKFENIDFEKELALEEGEEVAEEVQEPKEE